MRNTAVLIAASFLMASILSMAYGQAPGPQPSGADGPSAVPGPSSNDCMTQLLNMSDCLSYVTEGSNATVPDKPCCPELAGLVDSNPICLCQLLGKSDSFGIKIDLSKALKLPSVCNVTTPPASLCSAVGVPVGSPTGSEASMSPGSESPEALDASPSTRNDRSGASSTVGFVLPILLGLPSAFFLCFF